MEKTECRIQQDEVSAAVWPWCRSETACPGAAERALRKRAVVQALVAAVVGLIVYFLLKHRGVAVVVWVIAAVLLALGLFAPSAFKAVERGMQRFGQGVGTALTYLLLVPFFYLIFLPGHLLLRILRKDPLALKFPSEDASVWTIRLPIKPGHFKRQF